MMNLVLACLAGGFISLVIGAIWYSPKVFGSAWMKEVGMTEEDAQKGNMPMIFGIAFILSAYMAYEMKWINHDDPLPDFLHGMYHGAKNVGVFAVGALIINGLFEQKSFKYLAINAGYWLTVFAFIGGVLASFPSFKPKEKATETEETGMHIEFFDTHTISQTTRQKEDTYFIS